MVFKTDMTELRKKMSSCNINQDEIARRMGIDPSTFSRKMKSDGVKFTVGEVHRLADVLEMSAEEARHIFLQQNSHKCE